MKYRYKVEGINDDQEHEFEATYNKEFPNWIAEAAANDFWRKHCGYNKGIWPLTFTITDYANNFVGKFDVELELQPDFVAIEHK